VLGLISGAEAIAGCSFPSIRNAAMLRGIDRELSRRGNQQLRENVFPCPFL
jgi:hypothetical protein